MYVHSCELGVCLGRCCLLSRCPPGEVRDLNDTTERAGGVTLSTMFSQTKKDSVNKAEVLLKNVRYPSQEESVCSKVGVEFPSRYVVRIKVSAFAR